jgi:hypothetical protein
LENRAGLGMGFQEDVYEGYLYVYLVTEAQAMGVGLGVGMGAALGICNELLKAS